jgi:transposase
MGNGNRPTPEFRREAARLALTSGRTQREIAEDLGIGLSTLTRRLGQERDVRYLTRVSQISLIRFATAA